MGLDSTHRVELEAYTLINPIASFVGRSLADIKTQLGDITQDFLDNKAAQWPAVYPLVSLDAESHPGKILVVFWIHGKRVHSISESESTFDRLKRTKLATTAPSTTARPSIYETNQLKSSEKILDDRPEPDPKIPPIPLLYDGFGHFLDIFNGGEDVPGLPGVKNLELQKAVDDFASKMCAFYVNEDQRRSVALPALDRIFSARNGIQIPKLHASAIGSVRSDGHIVGEHGVGTLVVVLKNWPTGNTAIPEIELTGYVAHLHAKGMEEHREIFEGWRVPCLGLTVIGSDIKFYAIVAVDHQYRVVSLTPALSCIPSASDGRDRKELYAAFTAASVLQAHILQDTEKFVTTPPPKIPAEARRFPAISRLRRYPGSSDDYLIFQIQMLYPDQQSYRQLYIAETIAPDKQIIVVKFVREYSVDLHEFCAQRGHAPRILAFENLPGGWRAIAMEFISSGVPIIDSPRLAVCREKWMSELETLVDEFHERGFVHGDLRDPNIICDDLDRVMLVDFDWSGKSGQVFYPTPNLNPELLEGRTSGDLIITKDDDRRVLKRTLDKLKM